MQLLSFLNGSGLNNIKTSLKERQRVVFEKGTQNTYDVERQGSPSCLDPVVGLFPKLFFCTKTTYGRSFYDIIYIRWSWWLTEHISGQVDKPCPKEAASCLSRLTLRSVPYWMSSDWSYAMYARGCGTFAPSWQRTIFGSRNLIFPSSFRI
jgi:hypothetical protein